MSTVSFNASHCPMRERVASPLFRGGNCPSKRLSCPRSIHPCLASEKLKKSFQVSDLRKPAGPSGPLTSHSAGPPGFTVVGGSVHQAPHAVMSGDVFLVITMERREVAVISGQRARMLQNSLQRSSLPAKDQCCFTMPTEPC